MKKSVLCKLLNYRLAKLNYLRYTQEISHLFDGQYELKFQTLAIQKLITKKKELDRLYEGLNEQINSKEFSKYHYFLKKKYSSLEGMQAFIRDEKAHNQRIIDQYLSSVETSIYAVLYENHKVDTTKVKWGKAIINLQPFIGEIDSVIFQTQPDSLYDKQYITYHVKQAQNGIKWVTGFYKPKVRFSQAFIAKVYQDDSTQQVLWLKMLRRSRMQPSLGIQVEPMGKGCALIQSSIADTSTHFLSYVDSLGKIIKEDTLPSIYTPRFMHYDDINEKLLIVCKGNSLIEKKAELESLHALLIDKEQTVKNETEIGLQGYFVDFLQNDEGYYVFGNFTKLKNLNEKKITSEAMNIFMLKLPHQQSKAELYSFGKTTSLLKANKTNSSTFTLLGVKSKGNSTADLLKQKSLFYYGLISSQGKLLFEN